MTAMDVMRQRLRSLADDCDKRASESDSVEAIRLYRQAAPDARHAAVALHMGDYMRRAILMRCEALALAARLYDGEAIDWQQPTAQPPMAIVEAQRRPSDAMNARQLASLYDMHERGARKRIERGYRKGFPGFYRDGALWFADRNAFEGLRSRP